MGLKFLDRITEQDIRDSYDFNKNTVSNECINENKLQCYVVSVNDTDNSYSSIGIIYTVDIVNPNFISILDKNDYDYIRRHLYPRFKLWAPYCNSSKTQIGRRVYNVNFFLLSPFRRKGIAKVLYSLEETFYRKWGADEIHLTAAKDGKVVWRKFGFVMHCQDVGNVEKFYKEWCNDNGIQYKELKDLEKYPDEFLLSDDYIKNFRMYKELKYV